MVTLFFQIPLYDRHLTIGIMIDKDNGLLNFLHQLIWNFQLVYRNRNRTRVLKQKMIDYFKKNSKNFVPQHCCYNKVQLYLATIGSY